MGLAENRQIIFKKITKKYMVFHIAIFPVRIVMNLGSFPIHSRQTHPILLRDIYIYILYIYVYCQIDTGSLFTSNPNPSWNPVQQCKLLFCPMRSHDLQSVQRTHSWPQLYPLSVADSAIAQANPSLQPRGCGNNWFLEEPPG